MGITIKGNIREKGVLWFEEGDFGNGRSRGGAGGADLTHDITYSKRRSALRGQYSREGKKGKIK